MAEKIIRVKLPNKLHEWFMQAKITKKGVDYETTRHPYYFTNMLRLIEFGLVREYKADRLLTTLGAAYKKQCKDVKSIEVEGLSKDDLIDVFNQLTDTEKVPILEEAISHMEHNNRRSINDCIALAMGWKQDVIKD